MLPGEVVETVPDTPMGRIERWQRKLLDLSLRKPSVVAATSLLCEFDLDALMRVFAPVSWRESLGFGSRN